MSNVNGKVKLKRNRKKEKSLQALTVRFLKHYSHLNKGLINLQDIIEELNVEKRRIYDVFNILEAFKVIFRKEKNVYLWCGI
jgi:transcription factor E2F7/8